MTKFLSFLLCIVLLMTAVSCDSSPQDTAVTSNTADTSATADNIPKTYEEQKAVYSTVISEYTALLTAVHNGAELTAPDTDSTDTDKTLYGIVSRCKEADDAERFGYSYKDFDENGTPELILLNDSTIVFAIFTLADGAPILLEADYDLPGGILFAAENRFLTSRRTENGDTQETIFTTCRVDGEKMAYDSVHGGVYDKNKKETVEMFTVSDGKRTPIDKETFDELHWEHSKANSMNYGDTTKLLAPRIHFSISKGTASDVPSVDFSSYSAIRDTYKAISTCLDKFNSSAWLMGKYDNLFSFANDTEFEYYKHLLYASYHEADNVGYDEIDLNGDGTDELLLLNDDYRIKAIFTQKDGVPVMLDAFGIETCWLDEDGFIHVDYEDYLFNEIQYSVYELTKSGEYNFVYSLLVTEKGYRYLCEKGKRERITYEKMLDLYHDGYRRYSAPFGPNEYTRNVFPLTYTPLDDANNNIIKEISGKTFSKYGDIEKISNNETAYSYTHITCEGINDTQMKMDIKYTLDISHPDPDSGIYSWDEKQESFLDITADMENGILTFNENGIKGKIESSGECMWLIVEESTDERFAVGHHCFKPLSSQVIIPE